MKRSDRAVVIATRLAELYPEPPIPLAHHDAFTLLVAVVLSAQCTDKKVNEVTPELFRFGGSPETMAALPTAEILRIIRPLGLAPQKAKALSGLANGLLERFGGEVPADFPSLESLPGVGHKTASVVMSQIFGMPAFPVDTHIHRLAQRWGLSDGSSVTRTERDLKQLFPAETWRDLHLQIIHYGREHCTARGCDGTRCGLCRELFPKRRRPVAYRKA
ncbi:MAG: endonuclease III [Planctomycetaceae bacterium]|nr:MAG: endonuclease III [Planctomycetaceae bacterium]